ncbi:hypothetical protein FACS1894106_2740 [Spirochaetia bacterium]|nr:hypothetical protein FACS1894106_2740 [Spirochaetia bacterium]
MSRIRNVRPEFFRHEGLQDIEKQNPGKYPMFVFEGLWTKCDRQGVFEWKPRSLKLDILPFLDFDMSESLAILLKAKYIKKYIVEGKEYGIIITFLKHQKISFAEQKNQNVYPLPVDQHDLFDDIETDNKPSMNGSKTVFEPFQNAGNRKSEYGNSEILNIETGPAGSVAAPPEDVKPSPPISFPKKPKKTPLREREPENNMEKVEKAYLKNWDILYTEKRVKTPDPVVNWNQTRALLKKHFDRLAPEQIIQALNVGMTDNFIMSGGYSLGTMLSASVLNRLINSGQSGGPAPPPSLKDKKSLRGLDSW